ncbi:MAG TPA: aminotransferase class III-fold pyridoxal phosphate-dependent enzyme, partial [Cytophagales bacterium]|nr:aminotransferase class III-fold pyridoxal phosphate-dependent enzyme [Cytophagales bacterium]
PANITGNCFILPLNDEKSLELAMDESIAAVIVEGIQGVGGVYEPSESFLKKIQSLCEKFGALFILDEVQSGYGRTGKFFAHQYTDITPDLTTVAKGMGNGFPIAGVLIHPKIKAKHSMLGTTFGGNHLACAAGIAVLDIIEKENLLNNAQKVGEYLIEKIKHLPGIKEIRGKGLMIGIELEFACGEVRNELLYNHKIFTGSSSSKNTFRILPALNVTEKEIDIFVEAFTKVLQNKMVKQ